jgi:hypothetical protein
MKSSGKYIGLNQRIPFIVLDEAIRNLLVNDKVDRVAIFQHMLDFTSGKNRADKATKYVIQILSRQSHLLIAFKKGLKETSYENLSIADRKALCLCLISLTYPIAYDLLVALAQGFKVQNQINKKFISEKVMSIYGSNRTVDIAIDALMPMLIEYNTIRRDSIGIYSKSLGQSVSNQFIAELVIYSEILLSNSKSTLVSEIDIKPWYSYFTLSFQPEQSKYLLSLKDSAVGKGYLVIKS